MITYEKKVIGENIGFELDFSLNIDNLASDLHGQTISDKFFMFMSRNSTGVFQLADDVEKYCGLSAEEAQKHVDAGTDSAKSAYIYGLVNLMNGSKDIFFWTNATRFWGEVNESTFMETVCDFLTHEVGFHLASRILERHIAKNKGISFEEVDWKTFSPEIDEETRATVGGFLVKDVVNPFLSMAQIYLS